MLWIVPYISPDSPAFRELEAAGLLLRGVDGHTALRRWWNGVSAVLDLSNPGAADWFHGRAEALLALGVDGFKFDGADVADFRDDDLTGGVRRFCQALPPREHRLSLILLDAQIPQRLGLVANPHRITGRIEDETAHPGLVVGLRLSLRSEERLEVSVVVGEGPGVDIDLRRREFGAGMEVPPFGDLDVLIGLGRAPW